MGDYPTSRKLCPESDGIKLVSCLCLGPSVFFLLRPVPGQPCRLRLFWKMIFFAKAILFDMDGVLMNSTPSMERVWRARAFAHGIDPYIVPVQAHGRRSIEHIRAAASEMDAKKENVVVEQMEIDDKE